MTRYLGHSANPVPAPDGLKSEAGYRKAHGLDNDTPLVGTPSRTKPSKPNYLTATKSRRSQKTDRPKAG